MKLSVKTKLAIYIFLIGAGCGSAFSAQADYYTESAVLSTNLLSGKTDVAQITTFKATATVPAGTAVYASYSQDGTDWRDSVGVEGGWDALSAGDNSIDIRVLDWTTANFYYKIKFTNDDQTTTAVISQVEVEYSDTYTPYTPPWDGGYYIQGSMVSTDLLDGAGRGITGGDHFGYTISSLPASTHVYAQFSTDNANWYSSDGTLWGEDELSVGSHTSLDTALSLSELGWIGAASFYYKLNITATSENTPVITEAGLVEFTATIVSGGSETSTINSSQTSKMTEGLVLMQSFDGNHMDWSQADAEARDQSGQNNHGDVIGATAAIGKIGQGLDFNGTSGYVSQGSVSAGVKTIAFWIKADDLTDRKIIDIDGTDQIEIDGTGNILATSFPGATAIYIDGAASSALTAGWHHIVITDTIGVNASAMDIGRVTAGYFDGELDEIRLYTRALSGDEIGDLYRMGRVTFRK